MISQRNYLYVMPTPDYVKLGISTDPAKRLARHMTEANEILQFSDVWHSDIRKYKKVESVAKMILADVPQLTSELLYAPRYVVVEAIEKAAKTIGAPLIRFDALPFNEDAGSHLPKKYRPFFYANI